MATRPDVIALPMAESAMQMQALHAAFTPDADELRRAQAITEGFEAARARGEERALVDGLWVEVPTYRNARRLLERAQRLSARA
jgi:citrate lyase subunit beta/citryl-CoA lyase